MSIRAGQDCVAINIDGIARDQRTKDLANRLADSCVIELHNAIPAASHADVWIVWHELCAEDSVRVAVHTEPIRAHGSDQLPRHLIVEVDFEITASCHEFESIAGEVASHQTVVFLLDRML